MTSREEVEGAPEREAEQILRASDDELRAYLPADEGAVASTLVRS